MWVDTGAEVRARMRDRVGEAERQRLVARARAGRAGGPRTLAGYVRQAAAGGGLWAGADRAAAAGCGEGVTVTDRRLEGVIRDVAMLDLTPLTLGGGAGRHHPA